MKSILMTGITMIILGALALGYEYTYTTRETVLQIGPITAVADKPHTVAVPALLGWLLLGGGIGVVAFAALSRKN